MTDGITEKVVRPSIPYQSVPHAYPSAASQPADPYGVYEGKVNGAHQASPIPTLIRQHHYELADCSAIDPAVIIERGYGTYTYRSDVKEIKDWLKARGFPSRWAETKANLPLLWLPHWSPTGTRRAGQVKPWRPVANRDGKSMKYVGARGTSGLDVHPRWSRDPDPDGRNNALPAIKDPAVPLWITEGVKKADALTSRGVCTVALDGVYNWRSQHGTLGDWEDVRLKGREVTICFDADAITKPHVLQAMVRLGRWLRSKGVAKVWYLVTPAAVGDAMVKGVDDYFAHGGRLADLERAVTDKPPAIKSEEDLFTDSALAERAVIEALADRYLYVINMGWHRYDGRVWAPCPDAVVLESIREWSRDSYRWALQEESERIAAGKASSPYEVDAWRKVQSAGRLGSILKLAAGNAEIIRAGDDFDSWPDLLNTPGGVVDLPTGEVRPHDSAYLFTKITSVPYDPTATHPAFAKALEAVPAEARDWLQVRLGQATTGHWPDDERMLLLAGGGENGKTTIMDGVFGALGGKTGASGYAAAVPNTLLLRSPNGGGKGSATPEKMTLKGVRLAYIEETPEGRYLDTQAMKEVVGTPTMTGRELYKGFVTFGASHAIFLNSNYAPTVSETDHSTWRRLLRIDFPYRFVARPERPDDRQGDPAVKRAMVRDPDAHRAILAWLVAGARRWYEADQLLKAFDLPSCVEAATRRWRTDSDLVLAFMDECVRPEVGAWVATVDLYSAYAAWAERRGYKPKAERVFVGELLRHPEVPRGVEKRQVSAKIPGRSRKSTWLVGDGQDSPRPMAIVGLRFATEADSE